MQASVLDHTHTHKTPDRSSSSLTKPGHLLPSPKLSYCQLNEGHVIANSW